MERIGNLRDQRSLQRQELVGNLVDSGLRWIRQMHTSRASERGINEDAPGQFSLDIQVELLHIAGLIVRIGSFKFGPLSGVKSRSIAPAERTIDSRTERPICFIN